MLNSQQELNTLYHQDLYQWIENTIHKIQHHNLDQLDWENLILELEDLGNSQKHELESRLLVLFEHLLKLAYWQEEREYNSRGWKGTIIEQRKQIQKLLKRNPSLKSFWLEIFSETYQDARDITIVKTGLDAEVFPKEVFCTPEQAQAIDENWQPDIV